MAFSRRSFIVASLVVPLGFVTSLASACTCFPAGAKEDFAKSSVVFRGIVKNVQELPKRAESGRERYAVTFAVDQYWKGSPTREVILHVVAPGTDCVGALFSEGKDYVVFAVSQEARDYWLERTFWYGWLDLMPSGTKILTTHHFCDSTGETKSSGKILKALGKGRRPPAN